MFKRLWTQFRSSSRGEKIRSLIPNPVVNFFKHLPVAVSAAVWHRFPARRLEVIGVTGTDGKTTTASLIHHLLITGGQKAALISTVTAKIGEEEIPTGLHVTSPEPWKLQRLIKKAVDQGCRYLVLEVTSHALDQHRVWGIPFKIGILTNVSPEHLDYHPSYDHYLKTKAKLLNRAEWAIVNRDDPSFSSLKRSKGVKTITYGIRRKGNLVGTAISLSPTLTQFTYKCMDTVERGQGTELKIKTKLLGEHNVYNSLAAIGCLQVLGLDKKTIQKGLASFQLPPGRMEFVDQGQPFSVMIDFAHTPNALKKVLETTKTILSPSRLILIFGCAGLRDRQKRPSMGETAANMADWTVLTAEDSRTEDVNQIIDEIAQGCLKEGAQEQEPDQFSFSGRPIFFRIPDRQEAISFALQKLAQKGDLVLITGKGHERSMCFGAKEYPWSDKKAVEKGLELEKQ